MNARSTKKRWEVLQERLVAEFSIDGVVGTALRPFLAAEERHVGEVERTLHGHCQLSHAFQEFYLQTIQLAVPHTHSSKERPSPRWLQEYSALLLWHLSCFRIQRATDVLFHRGYPLDAFARLRTLKDLALAIAAVLNGAASTSELSGLEGTKLDRQRGRETMGEIRKRRRASENRARTFMLAEGLNEEDRAELREWADWFDRELHGAQASDALYSSVRSGQIVVQVLPVFNKNASTMYVNRWAEVSWMLHRTLPCMQLEAAQFGERWSRRWSILDENLAEMVRSLEDLKKPIAAAFRRFIDKKYAFQVGDCFRAPGEGERSAPPSAVQS